MVPCKGLYDRKFMGMEMLVQQHQNHCGFRVGRKESALKVLNMGKFRQSVIVATHTVNGRKFTMLQLTDY